MRIQPGMFPYSKAPASKTAPRDSPPPAPLAQPACGSNSTNAKVLPSVSLNTRIQHIPGTGSLGRTIFPPSPSILAAYSSIGPPTYAFPHFGCNQWLGVYRFPKILSNRLSIQTLILVVTNFPSRNRLNIVAGVGAD